MLVTIVTALITSSLALTGGLILAQHRMRREFQLEFSAETVIRKLLQHKRWELRSFAQIKHHLGGFEDNELRRLLVRAGALRFEAGGQEIWGLFDRVGVVLDRAGGYHSSLNSDDVERLKQTGQP